MRDDIRAAKSPPSLALRMQILNFIMNLNSQSNNDEKNTHVKITRRQRRFEGLKKSKYADFYDFSIQETQKALFRKSKKMCTV